MLTDEDRAAHDVKVRMSNIWQEYDCPVSGIDFDLHGDEMLSASESCRCSGCAAARAAVWTSQRTLFANAVTTEFIALGVHPEGAQE